MQRKGIGNWELHYLVRPWSIFCVLGLLGEDDQGLRPAQEGLGIDALVLDPENTTGDLALILGTEVKERKTESADRKVFPV